MEKAVDFYNNERPHMSLNNMTPRQAASCMGKLQKKWTSYREKYLENLKVQEGSYTFASQNLNMLEQLSAEAVQDNKGLEIIIQLLPGLRIRYPKRHSTKGRVKG